MSEVLDINAIIDVLENLSPIYRNKKQAVEDANKQLDNPLSYNTWKHLWQRSHAVNTALDFLLIKNHPVLIKDKNANDGVFAFWDNELDEEYELDIIEKDENFLPIINGVTAYDQIPDPLSTYEKMIAYFDKIDEIQTRKSNQTISFSGGPICIVNIADIHFGGAVDVKRVFRDISIINDTPRMYINFLGDLGNNFVGSWTRKINHNSPFTIAEEHAISKYYIEQISRRLIAFTAGNHDNWTIHESGIDMMKNYLNEVGSSALYDPYENIFTIDVDGFQSIVRTRHQWLGSSQYNDTHSIEKAAKFDKGLGFDIGVGGHTHRSGLYREFNNGGKTGVAILCGTYKRVDDYAREVGFPQSNKSTAVCLIVDPDSESGYYGISDIAAASKFMKCITK